MLRVMQTQDLTPELREGHAKLARAVSLACSYHQQQVRKGTTIPYVSHLLQVAGLVLEYGGDLEQAAVHLLHALERGEVGIVSSSRLMPTIVLARAAKACVDLGLRPGPSLVEFVAANPVGDMSFGVALRRHRADMTPTQAREVLGMSPAQTRPRKSVR